MSTSENSTASRRMRRLQTRAAWRVFLKRPMTIAILLIQLFLFLITLTSIADNQSAEDLACTGLRSNAPAHPRGIGTRLVQTEDFRRYFESGETAYSITGLDFRLSASINPREGSSFLMLRRIRSGASGPQIAESVPFEQVGRLMLQFPNVQWIRFRGQQLRKTSPEVLNQLRELETIELESFSVNIRDVERLSQITSLRHLTLTALWCDVDLSLLKRLPSLTSVHLTSGSMSSTERGRKSLLSKDHVTELAQLPHLKELVLESDTLLTGARRSTDTLTDEESRKVSEFANVLSAATELRTVYVGSQHTASARLALRQLRTALPQVSVRPAWSSGQRGPVLMPAIAACLFSIGMVAFHFLACSSVPQSVLIPGSHAASQRVFLLVLLILLVCQLPFLIMVAEISPVAAVAAWLAGATLTLKAVSETYAGANPSERPRVQMSWMILVMVPMAMGLTSLLFGDRIEWFMYGEQPRVAGGIIVVSLCFMFRAVRSFAATHTRWAENGMAPAATVQEVFENFKSLQQKSAKLSRVERIGAAWQTRLGNLKASAADCRYSFCRRTRLWMMAMSPMSLWQIVWRIGLIVPLSFLPMLTGNYLSGASLTTQSPMLMPLAAMGILGGGVVTPISLYGRFSVFASEVLRPVSRSAWRETVLSSIVLLTIGFNLSVWLLVNVIGVALGAGIEPVWLILSLLATIAFSLVGASLVAWLIAVRRVVFSAGCVVVYAVASTPVIATLTGGRGPTGNVYSDFPSPAFWLTIIAAELLVGILIFALAWRRLATIELGA